ncbi:MAG: hypothetical protein ABS913_01455 [Desemzia incerta]|uniref:hypothetical protein n=1 Tax=Desemzia incerta TaxID=82801 RepID=UPI003314D4A4
MSDLNEEFRDRGIKKWAGFYLSEHTAVQESLIANRKKVNHQKPQMGMDEIISIINEAVLKSKQVAIQVEEVDANSHYNDDVVGPVSGGDEMGIYVGHTKINFDEIRNIQFVNFKKWNQLD